MCINVRQGLTVAHSCGIVSFTSEQDKRSAQENGQWPAEGVTLSGVPQGTRTVRGCDSGEARPRVPKVQSGISANLSGKRTETNKLPRRLYGCGPVFAPS